MNVSPQVGEAFKRGIIDALVVSLIVAGFEFFTNLATTPVGDDFDFRRAAVLAGATFFGSLVARTAEGKFDSNRASRGDVIPADVGA